MFGNVSFRTKDILTAITGEYHIMRIGLPHLSSWPDDLMDQWVWVWAIFASAELAPDREGKLKIASDFWFPWWTEPAVTSEAFPEVRVYLLLPMMASQERIFIIKSQQKISTTFYEILPLEGEQSECHMAKFWSILNLGDNRNHHILGQRN